MPFTDHPHCRPFTEAGHLSQINAWYEDERHILWVMLNATPRPCFNRALLNDITKLGRAMKTSGVPIKFWVLGSSVPNMFNAGGDLDFFSKRIREQDPEALLDYARACVDAIYMTTVGFELDVITIAMVEGSALGGGFEAALAHDFVFAREGVRMGFPEIAFNLFPGMGAYSLVARKGTRHLAEHLMFTGSVHDAEWYAERHLVDRVFPADQGMVAVRTFVDEVRPKINGIRAMLRARRTVSPLPKSELMAITEDWVKAAMAIEEKDLGYMERLVLLQSRGKERRNPANDPNMGSPAPL